MKTIKKISLLILMMGIFPLTSCEKWIKDDINIDPNNPSDVTLDLILPGLQGSYGYLLGSDASRFPSLFIQHHAGVDRQHSGFDQYVLNESDVNNSWNFIFSTVLNELQAMKTKAGSSPHYGGIVNVMNALVLMNLTDQYGDMPFSDAFKGLDQLQPAYDSQEQLYGTIQALLNQGITDVQQGSSVFSPGSDDLVYGGDLQQWVKLANGLKARAFLHLGKVDASNYGNALAAIDAGAFTSNADDAQITFGVSTTNANPLYLFMAERGDIRMSKFFIDLMQGKNDPRLPFYAEKTVDGIYRGSPNGDGDATASEPGAFYASATSPVPYFSYAEQKFIEAEAAFQTGDIPRATSAFNDAISASLTKITGAVDPVYLAAEIAGPLTLEKIMTQKYITMYSQAEAWTDYRRTGFPTLTPVSGTEIPSRFPYAQSERLYNQKNFPGQKSIFDELWWDRP